MFRSEREPEAPKEIVIQTQTHLLTIQPDMHIDISRIGRFDGDMLTLIMPEDDEFESISIDPQELADLLFGFAQAEGVSQSAKLALGMMLAKSGLQPRGK